MSIEAMKQALEALDDRSSLMKWQAAREALRQAIEQAEKQEPKCQYPRCSCNSKDWCDPARQQALDKKAENARELGLDYEPAQAEKQEPVADLVECGNCHEGLSDMDHVCKKCLGAGWVRNPDTIPQPQREWVGLTDDEMLMIYGQNHEGKKYSLGRMVQAKLKEKNT